jgi:hypothetical protein
MTRKFALIALVATAAFGTSMFVATNKAQAATWACGSVGQLSCHSLPCIVGDTSISVGGVADHCVSPIAFNPANKLPDARATPHAVSPTPVGPVQMAPVVQKR